MSNSYSLESRRLALRALHILQSNERQSVATAVFHDEVCGLDKEISRFHDQCVMALELGGCRIKSMPRFTDWMLKMGDKDHEVFNYDIMTYMRKSIAKIERERASAVETLKRRLRIAS